MVRPNGESTPADLAGTTGRGTDTTHKSPLDRLEAILASWPTTLRFGALVTISAAATAAFMSVTDLQGSALLATALLATQVARARRTNRTPDNSSEVQDE
ncbi:hypothetical protein ALI144C_35895 [Actinosynnema sp. ALI-1.44]|nr:hypothetical protein ALI144C_35895 [Actinosynnema sp. ALI-1.44]